MVFRSQKLRGYGGIDSSSDLAIYAIAVLVIGLFVGVFAGIAAILGDAVDPNASRAIPIALCSMSLIPILISSFYLRWRFRRMASRSRDGEDELRVPDDDE